jgi:branched-chain amino acid transport system permease protein
VPEGRPPGATEARSEHRSRFLAENTRNRVALNLDIALLLAQDGITNGAIYALLALALVLAFAVTRVIFIPQGEFVAYGALTLVAVQAGRLPGTIWLLIAAGALVSLIEVAKALRARRADGLAGVLGWNLAYPLLLWALLAYVKPQGLPMALQILLALAVVVPLGPMIYRLAYQPLAEASVLILLIVSVAVHVVLVGLGLLLFGAEGSRTPPFSDGRIDLGTLTASAQSLWVVGCSIALIVLLYLAFERTVYGKALRATAVNRLGARLMGIPTEFAGRLSFFLCALIGALSGILIAPITTIYYDTGFLIGLKGFVGAIIGGLASYPVAALGALLVGLLESYSSFWASAYKEVIVFTLIIPVLLARSLRARHVEEDE